MNSSIPVSAVISAIRPLAQDVSLYTLQTEPGNLAASSFLAGQFLELSLPGVGEIPVSYCGYPTKDGSIELCIRHIGHVTIPLKTSAAGNVVALRGPFGVGFPMSAYNGQDLVLIAGGLGMAPLRSLLLTLLARRKRYGKITVLYGARDAESLLFLDELLELQRQGAIALSLAVDRTDHGLANVPGCRIVLLPELLDQLAIDPGRTFAAVCGPPVVYPYLVSALQVMALPDDRIHLSLERRMKCGVGRCGHCAVGRYLCCVDGPVFSCAQLAGIEGALG
ncbi:MAG: FAD/NAD(P)-binding protein [Desulfuromonadaceae bacterium]|nr:FAD/NAD(P)-binding protein [Desulfuromonadaceae bacterium]MDD5105475.1 FAD/NAD(P)-binding protein [Desulfuromonadaceae bacterium]